MWGPPFRDPYPRIDAPARPVDKTYFSAWAAYRARRPARMKFPAILTTAVLRGSQVLLLEGMSDDELVEYMQWKSALRIAVLTPSKLRSLFRTGVEKDAIRRLFKNNNKYIWLTQEMKRRTKVSDF